LSAGKKVAYYPETAYWIAFDDSVPLYLPLYIRSRFLDLSQLRSTAMTGGFSDLDEHVQFSSGFEWGYWQQDRATLRMNYELPASWEDTLSELFPAALSADIVNLTNAQHDALIGERLAAYLAGRDAYLDAGVLIGIISQPNRPAFSDVAAMTPTAMASFQSSVLTPLGAFATNLQSLADTISHDADTTDPDQAEVADGAAIDATRARFIYDLYAAAVAKGTGGDTATPLADAQAALQSAKTIVARRHATIRPMYYQDGLQNATIYPYGYLTQADTLCYFQRELVQLTNLLSGKNDIPDGCIS